MEPNNENIQFSIDFLNDKGNENNKNHNKLLPNMEEIHISSINHESNDFIMFDYLNYANHTVKELILICEFYNIAKELKTKKANKETIINALQIYENDATNYEIVARRHNFWFYMNELKNDKFMKKLILWH